MTWSVTINNLQDFDDFPDEVLERFAEYHADMYRALELATSLDLESCTLSGGRMPSIGDDSEMVDITIRGFTKNSDFNETMKELIAKGPGHDILLQRRVAL